MEIYSEVGDLEYWSIECELLCQKNLFPSPGSTCD